MLTKADQILIFCGTIGCRVVKEQNIQKGKNIYIERGSERTILSLFENGSIRVQGPNNSLKQLLLVWNNKEKSTATGWSEGMADLASGWREWNEEARWLRAYIEEYGLPEPGKEPDAYDASREIMFHDYVFRDTQFHTIDRDVLDGLLRNWLSRYCFMNIDVEKICSDFWENIDQNDSEGKNPTIADIAWSLSYALVTHCPQKFVDGFSGQAVCPFTGDSQNGCLCDIMDMIYPYCSSKKMLSYTKSNFENLLSDLKKLSWIDISSSTPIEKAMEEGLRSAGILAYPQYQAYDHNHRYKIDFVVKTNVGIHLAIECDGLEFHARKENYIRDRQRDRYLQERNFYLMRFSSVEIFNNLDSCINEIDRIFWRLQRREVLLASCNKRSYYHL